MEKKYRFTLDDSIVNNIIKYLIILIVLLILIVFDVTGIINISTEYTKWLYIIIGVYFLLLLSLNARIIRYIEIGPKSITIVKVIGKIVLKDYTTIEPINLYLLDNDVTYRYQDEGQDIIMHGLTMKETSFNSNKNGSFTRISNNLNELAMVECNGKKYLINYPKELFKNIEQ